ncbi:HAD-IIIA family hydrolase [bacterium]|nr:HAD-IIIA family hydrolase [bacterium]
MSEQRASFPKSSELKEYVLLLDRDGVINEPKPDDYVKSPEEFLFCKGAIKAIETFQHYFDKIVIVTNQQGIGRELMTEKDLQNVHLKMYDGLRASNLPYFDLTCYAPYLRSENHAWRKPQTGMVDYVQSILSFGRTKYLVCGDSPGDMQLGRNVGAFCVNIANPQFEVSDFDLRFDSLSDFAHFITQN